MNQGNMDDKIKDIFGSLDEKDMSAATDRKERIWSKIESDKPKKKSNQWWLLLLLLLGALFFAAGWFISGAKTNTTAPVIDEKTPIIPAQNSGLQFALNAAQSTIIKNQKSIDSLHTLNNSLVDRLMAMSQKSNKREVMQPSIDTRIIRDTVYLTEVKIEQRIVEKIIKDTIILEVLGLAPTLDAMADANENIPEEKLEKEPSVEKATLPSSIQFNFSETNHLDK